MSGHGPDAETFERASKAELKPVKLDGTLAFMFETRFACRPTKFAMDTAQLQHEYYECWQTLKKSVYSVEGRVQKQQKGATIYGRASRLLYALTSTLCP